MILLLLGIFASFLFYAGQELRNQVLVCSRKTSDETISMILDTKQKPFKIESVNEGQSGDHFY
jgi:hypothetical protein